MSLHSINNILQAIQLDQHECHTFISQSILGYYIISTEVCLGLYP
jgi:hypothetical protein